MNKYDLTEPTSPTAVVVGTINGKKRLVARAGEWGQATWVLYHHTESGRVRYWYSWDELLDLFDTMPRIVDVGEEAKPTPGPWLRGSELDAIMPTLKAGDVVEAEREGHTATGELWEDKSGGLLLRRIMIRWPNSEYHLGALRIIERAPEPGADIPDEVVDAAMDALYVTDTPTGKDMRAALAAADAKRAELAGGEHGTRSSDIAKRDERPNEMQAKPCAKCERMETHAVGLEGIVSRRNRTIEDLRQTIAKRDERIKELEAKPILTDEQAEAVRLTVKYVEDHDGEVGTALLREVFPDVFTPKFEWAEDQVVMVKFRVHSGEGWKVARRDDDGEWTTRDDVNPVPENVLDERYEVRRLSSAARAELLTIMRGEQA